MVTVKYSVAFLRASGRPMTVAWFVDEDGKVHEVSMWLSAKYFVVCRNVDQLSKKPQARPALHPLC